MRRKRKCRKKVGIRKRLYKRIMAFEYKKIIWKKNSQKKKKRRRSEFNGLKADCMKK